MPKRVGILRRQLLAELKGSKIYSELLKLLDVACSWVCVHFSLKLVPQIPRFWPFLCSIDDIRASDLLLRQFLVQLPLTRVGVPRGYAHAL